MQATGPGGTYVHAWVSTAALASHPAGADEAMVRVCVLLGWQVSQAE